MTKTNFFSLRQLVLGMTLLVAQVAGQGRGRDFGLGRQQSERLSMGGRSAAAIQRERRQRFTVRKLERDYTRAVGRGRRAPLRHITQLYVSSYVNCYMYHRKRASLRYFRAYCRRGSWGRYWRDTIFDLTEHIHYDESGFSRPAQRMDPIYNRLQDWCQLRTFKIPSEQGHERHYIRCSRPGSNRRDYLELHNIIGHDFGAMYMMLDNGNRRWAETYRKFNARQYSDRRNSRRNSRFDNRGDDDGSRRRRRPFNFDRVYNNARRQILRRLP